MSGVMLRRASPFVAMALFAWNGTVQAQLGTMYPYQEHDKQVRASEQVAPLASDLFGDQVSLYDRQTAFEQVDIDLPGNNALPVQLRRRLQVRPKPSVNAPQDYAAAGNWEIAVPYITGTFDAAYGWNRTSVGETPRCSTNFYPYTPPPHRISEIWSGYSVHVPGRGTSELIGRPADEHRPSDGETRRWLTKEFDSFSCTPMVSGYPGEGFVMRTNDGVEYTFNVGITRFAGNMGRHGDEFRARPRVQVYLLASRIEDRFGNWVTYAYDASGHPTEIESSDGRRIVLSYSGGRLASATSHGREWTYQYTSGRLASVVLPDGSNWSFVYQSDMRIPYEVFDAPMGPTCSQTAPLTIANFGIDITHPSGALGEFRFQHSRHYRSGVPQRLCISEGPPGPLEPPQYSLVVPNYFDVFSLVGKEVSGSGIPEPQRWTYVGSTSPIPLWGGLVPPCTSCPASKEVVVTQPDGSQLRETYGILFSLNEGKLLKKEILDAAGVVRSIETLEYMSASDAAGQPFPNMYGSPYGLGDPSRLYIRPLEARTVQQQGADFSWRANSFDVFARPLSVTRSSTGAGTPSKIEVTQYHDNLGKWVLGQPSRLTVNGVVASETSYHATTALPTVFKEFGRTVQTRTYNADGTVATVKDGNNHVTTLSGWRRGVPQTIRYPATPESPSGATRSALVNDHGWITRITDENGFATNYQYDPMGRLSRIVYPTGDDVPWNDTVFTFAKAASSAYGIPAGHWQRTMATGSGRKVSYLDALWRPVLTREYDIGDASGTQRFVKQAFDHEGRVTFASYPSASGTPSTGTWTDYDALGRVRSVAQDSEHGPLVTLTAYMNNADGYYTRVTSPKGEQTRTWFHAFDEPDYGTPAMIWHPEGARTTITRDSFGRPTEIKRHNADGSVAIARKYVYRSDYHTLCKIVEPETGATVQDHDAAGNLLWTAAGLGLTSTADCNYANVPAAAKTTRSYDARNRVRGLVFPDNLGNTSYDYTPDGKLAQVSVDNGGSGVVTTAYTYNKRRLPTGEAVSVGAHAWGIGYAYNANGHLSAHTLPGGTTVGYNPNALGQPRQAGSYATGVTYFPNGAIKQFGYGNGAIHTLTQNARGLPERSRDVRSGTAIHDDSLDYDAHGNVAAISDGLSGGRGDRTMTYDGLDRLTSTVSPMFGTASYTYDVLDNLQRVRLTAGPKSRDHTYVYDANQRLSLITHTSGGGTVSSLGYDAQGNLSSRDGQAYAFDRGNRLRQATGLEQYQYDGHGRRVRAIRNGASIYSVYGQDGMLRFQRDERSGKLTEYVHLGGSLVAQLSDPIPLGTPALTVPGYSSTGAYTVSWTAAAQASKYQLQERTNGGSWSTIHDAAGTSKAVSGKPAGTYGYRVRACNASACGDWSVESSATVQLAPASAPSLTAPATGLNGSYTLSWTPVASAATYRLVERQGSSGSWSPIHEATAISKTVTGRAAGAWHYQVQACNVVGCGPYSSVGIVQVVHPPASAPTLTAPSTNYTGSYEISWTSVSTSTRYELVERLGSGSWSTIHNAAARSKAISGKTAGAWRYQVRACNAAGCSAYSALKTTNVTLKPADAPTLTAPASNATGSYGVSWSSVSAATRYQLQERQGSGSWSTIHDAAARSMSLTGKTTGSWGYQVRACNAAGCGGFSAVRTVVVTLAPTGAPNLAGPSNSASGHFTISWAAVAAATTYRVQERLGSGSWSEIHDGASRSVSLIGKPNGQWGYRALACNSTGCGPFSSTKTVTVQLLTPPVPTGLRAQQVSSMLCRITWNSVSGASSYQLQSSGSIIVYEGSIPRYDWDAQCFPPYRVAACNAHGCSAWSAAVGRSSVPGSPVQQSGVEGDGP